jgi:hypothetical protein
MPRRAYWILAAVGMLPAAWPAGAAAQPRVTLGADLLFYGDNTEFRNPFREGETLLGTAVRLGADADISDRVTVTLGVFANQRFGADSAFELVRPVLSMTVRGRRSTIVFGTLAPARIDRAPGADRMGPHGLLPALQRETLAFERPYEAGLEWTFDGSRLRHDVWIDWQRVNTPEHRERFDAGAAGEWRIAGPFAVPVQVHIVHEGGQQFASGPVADSAAAAAGVKVSGRAGRAGAASIEAHALVSRFVPDRAARARDRDGKGLFGRAALEHRGWRAHVLFWRGRHFIKDEADPNYLSVRRDGTLYPGIRDYSEAGLARTFRPAPGVTLFASARIHRIERHYEYSYRVLGTTVLRWPLRR